MGSVMGETGVTSRHPLRGPPRSIAAERSVAILEGRVEAERKVAMRRVNRGA